MPRKLMQTVYLCEQQPLTRATKSMNEFPVTNQNSIGSFDK